MITLDRTNTNVVGQWWWTIDRWVLASLLLLMIMGVLLITAASPAVAIQHKWASFHFIKKHLLFLVPTLGILIGTSFLPLPFIKKLACLLFFFSLTGVVLTLLVGVEVKGASRWLEIGGFSLQPSEFVKPTFAIVSAMIFAHQKSHPEFPATLVAIALYGIVTALLLLQPDLGMTALITMTWLSQFFLAGLPLFWIFSAGLCGIGGLTGAYFLLPHVTQRMDHFLYPTGEGKFGNRYQILQSLEAFLNGGLLGKGPGEGTVKKHLPDAHADFIFAVAGEEFGLIFCLFLVSVFGLVILRSFGRLFTEKNMFIILAVTGLITQFGLQAIINMASTLNLMPTKGMTLPFISYGGSSMLALALGMGMVLALTRRRIGDHGQL